MEGTDGQAECRRGSRQGPEGLVDHWITVNAACSRSFHLDLTGSEAKRAEKDRVADTSRTSANELCSRQP